MTASNGLSRRSDDDLCTAPRQVRRERPAHGRRAFFPVANLQDIIASKRASGRMKDRLDLHLLELFRLEYESRNSARTS
jgi:hypothetical protein